MYTSISFVSKFFQIFNSTVWGGFGYKQQRQPRKKKDCWRVAQRTEGKVGKVEHAGLQRIALGSRTEMSPQAAAIGTNHHKPFSVLVPPGSGVKGRIAHFDWHDMQCWGRLFPKAGWGERLLPKERGKWVQDKGKYRSSANTCLNASQQVSVQ